MIDYVTVHRKNDLMELLDFMGYLINQSSYHVQDPDWLMIMIGTILSNILRNIKHCSNYIDWKSMFIEDIYDGMYG